MRTLFDEESELLDLARSMDEPILAHAANARLATLFSRVMTNQLHRATEKGKQGWHDPDQVSVETLRGLMDAALSAPEPDFADVANYAMMLHYRTGQAPL